MINIKGIPVFNALVTDEETGMFRISLVDDPAVQSNFLAFDAQRKMQMYAVADEEKRLVLGVVMRANFPIYRTDERMGEYYVVYTPEETRKMAEKYLAEGRQNDVNLMHQEDTDVQGVHMVQYFFKDSSKGIVPEGFADIADGSLFAEFHIVNDEVWGAVKEGTYKGFSLEGCFDLVPTENDMDEVADIIDSIGYAFKKVFKNTNKEHMSKLSRLKAALVKVLTEFGNVTTDKGILAWDGEEDLKAGDLVYIEDAEGNRVPAEDGEYVTMDNKTIVVAEGKVAEIRDPEAEVDSEPVAEEAPVAEAFGSIATDKAELYWEGEEDLKADDLVFVEKDGERVAAEDGEYTTEDGKVIVVVEGKVAEIRDAKAEVAPEPNAEVEELKKKVRCLEAENAELKGKVEKMSKEPIAKAAHAEVTTSVKFGKTGNKGIDNLARILGAK